MAKVNLLDLEEKSIVGSIKGQKIYLYGTNGTGKSYVCSKLPKPLLLMLEPGGNAIKCCQTPVTRWSVFKDFVNQLVNDKLIDDPENKGEKIESWKVMQRKFQTIVIDPVENLVELAENSVCQEFGVRDLSEITGKQNGYSIYRKDFRTQINRLCSVGYTVVFIGHEEKIEVTDEITGEKFDFTQPKGTNNIKSSTRFIRDICDFCFYLKPNGIDENGDVIPSTAICKQTKTVFARSRYAVQTYIKPFTAKGLEEAITKAIERSAQEEGAELSDWTESHDGYDKDTWIAMIKPYFAAVGHKYPEKIKEVIAIELGEGHKISECTNDNLVELENIYNQLVTFACDMGIVVED